MSGAFASGKHAWGECMRCGARRPYLELVSDGQKPGLRVCPGCRDAKHPAEKPFNASDAQALKNPAPDVDDDSEGGTGTTLAEELFPNEHYFGGGT